MASFGTQDQDKIIDDFISSFADEETFYNDSVLRFDDMYDWETDNEDISFESSKKFVDRYNNIIIEHNNHVEKYLLYMLSNDSSFSNYLYNKKLLSINNYSDVNTLSKNDFKDASRLCRGFIMDKVMSLVNSLNNPNDDLFLQKSDYISDHEFKTIGSLKKDRIQNNLNGKNTISRSTAFLISFALDLPTKLDSNSSHYYSHEALFNRVFNTKYCIRNPFEFCLMYAKYHHKSYKFAYELYIDFLAKKDSYHMDKSDAFATQYMIQEAISPKIAPNDFVEILLKSADLMTANNSSVMSYIDTLVERINENPINDFVKNHSFLTEFINEDFTNIDTPKFPDSVLPDKSLSINLNHLKAILEMLEETNFVFDRNETNDSEIIEKYESIIPKNIIHKLIMFDNGYNISGINQTYGEMISEINSISKILIHSSDYTEKNLILKSNEESYERLRNIAIATYFFFYWISYYDEDSIFKAYEQAKEIDDFDGSAEEFRQSLTSDFFKNLNDLLTRWQYPGLCSYIGNDLIWMLLPQTHYPINTYYHLIRYIFKKYNIYVPLPSKELFNLANPFTKDNFEYNKEEDVYICPNAKRMTQIKDSQSKTNDKKRKKRRYYTESCDSCVFCKQCTGKNEKKIITK
jgi:hypothetical protein